MFAEQARASAQQGTLVNRELHRQAYNDALVQRYSHLPDIRRIQRHRRLPAPLYKVADQPAIYAVLSMKLCCKKGCSPHACSAPHA